MERMTSAVAKRTAFLFGVSIEAVKGHDKIRLRPKWDFKEGWEWYPYQLLYASEAFYQVRSPKNAIICGDEPGIGKGPANMLYIVLNVIYTYEYLKMKSEPWKHLKPDSTADKCPSQHELFLPCPCVKANFMPDRIQHGITLVLVYPPVLLSWKSTLEQMFKPDSKILKIMRISVEHGKPSEGMAPPFHQLSDSEWEGIRTRPIWDEKKRKAEAKGPEKKTPWRWTEKWNIHDEATPDRAPIDSYRYVLISTTNSYKTKIAANFWARIDGSREVWTGKKQMISKPDKTREELWVAFIGSLLIDEFHETKRPDTEAMKLIVYLIEHQLPEYRPFFAAISGTPLATRPSDLTTFIECAMWVESWATAAKDPNFDDCDYEELRKITLNDLHLDGGFDTAIGLLKKKRRTPEEVTRAYKLIDHISPKLAKVIAPLMMMRTSTTLNFDGNKIQPCKAKVQLLLLLVKPDDWEERFIKARENTVRIPTSL
jgi:hypothetical protein